MEGRVFGVISRCLIVLAHNPAKFSLDTSLIYVTSINPDVIISNQSK